MSNALRVFRPEWGSNMTAQGNALGCLRETEFPALKGRTNDHLTRARLALLCPFRAWHVLARHRPQGVALGCVRLQVSLVRGVRVLPRHALSGL